MKSHRIGVLLSLLLILWSCNEDYPNLLKGEYSDDVAGKSTRVKKVLYVIIDGVNGDVLKEVTPVHISEMADHSVYSFDGLTDIDQYTSNIYTGWMTLLTGKTPLNHQVIETNTTPDLEANPTVFQILKDKSSAVFSSSADFEGLVRSYVSASTYSDTDEEVSAAAVAALKTETTDLTVVNLTGVDIAGRAGGYNTENAGYVDAISTADSYLHDMVEAISARADYKKEDWLVIITSNRGSDYGAESNSPNYFLNPAKNNFVMYYHPQLTSRYYARPGTEIPFVSPVAKLNLTLTGKGKAELPDANEFKFNMPDVGDGYTVEMKIKYSGNGTSSSWPEILSKGANRDNAPNGWVINSPSGQGMYQVRVGTARITDSGDGSLFGNGEWHTLTLTFRRTAATSILFTRYLDGKAQGSGTASISSPILGDNSDKLAVGLKSTTSVSGTPLLSVSNLTIFNIPFTNTDVSNNYCKTEVTDEHPYYTNLIGFWAFNEGTGNRVPNKLDPENTNQAFVFSGTTTWENVNEYAQYLCPPLSDAYYKVVPFSADAPLTVLQWLGAPVYMYNNLDGRTWPFNYSNLKAE